MSCGESSRLLSGRENSTLTAEEEKEKRREEKEKRLASLAGAQEKTHETTDNSNRFHHEDPRMKFLLRLEKKTDFANKK